jgi:hypothetical protein
MLANTSRKQACTRAGRVLRVLTVLCAAAVPALGLIILAPQVLAAVVAEQSLTPGSDTAVASGMFTFDAPTTSLASGRPEAAGKQTLPNALGSSRTDMEAAEWQYTMFFFQRHVSTSNGSSNAELFAFLLAFQTEQNNFLLAFQQQQNNFILELLALIFSFLLRTPVTPFV